MRPRVCVYKTKKNPKVKREVTQVLEILENLHCNTRQA